MAIKWGRKNKTKKANTASIDSKSTPEAKRISNTLDSVLIVEDKPRYVRLKKFLEKKGLRGKKLAVVALAALVVLSMAVYFLFIRSTEKPAPVRETNVCTEGNAIYRDAAQSVQSSNGERAMVLIDQIAADPRHAEDVDCMVALVELNLIIGNTSKADTHMKELLKISDSSSKLNKEFSEIGVKTIKDVEHRLGMRKTIYEESKGNVLHVN